MAAAIRIRLRFLLKSVDTDAGSPKYKVMPGILRDHAEGSFSNRGRGRGQE